MPWKKLAVNLLITCQGTNCATSHCDTPLCANAENDIESGTHEDIKD